MTTIAPTRTPTRTPEISPDRERKLDPDRLCPSQKERVTKKVIEDI